MASVPGTKRPSEKKTLINVAKVARELASKANAVGWFRKLFFDGEPEIIGFRPIQKHTLTRSKMKLGAARAKGPAAWRLVDVEVASEGASFSYALNRKKTQKCASPEGRYLLRTNLSGKILPSYGNSISNSLRSKRCSKTSRMI